MKKALLTSIITMVVVFCLEVRAQQEESKGPSSPRLAQLNAELARYKTAAAIEPYFGAAIGTFGVGLSAYALTSDKLSSGSKARFVLLAGTPLAVGGFGSYALPHDYQTKSASITLDVAMAGLLTAVAFAPDASRSERTALLINGGSWYASAALRAVDLLLLRPVSARSLYAGHERLERAGDETSDEELSELEAAYKRTSRPIPLWLPPLVPFVTGAASAAIIAQSDLSKDERETGVAFGLLSMGGSFFPLLTGLLARDYDDYATALRQRGVVVTGSSGSVMISWVGQF